MAFCSLPCWTYFSALLRTFCLLNPNNAIRVRTPDPGLDTEPADVSGNCSRVLPRGPSQVSADGPTGQGQLYVWTSRTAWLPRVTERECTKGLRREPGRSTAGGGESSADILPAVARAFRRRTRRARTPAGQPPGRRRYSMLRNGVENLTPFGSRMNVL